MEIKTLEELGYELTSNRFTPKDNYIFRKWENHKTPHDRKHFSEIHIYGDKRGILVNSKDGFTIEEWMATTLKLKELAKELIDGK